MDDLQQSDICRVCRSEGSPDRPLFHPCICTGSIKFIHQECLVQWLRYSRKEYCELCNYRFSFTPIYSPDMPKRLPIKDIVSGLLTSVATAVRYWFHYTLVALAWLGLVPLMAYRIYCSLFSGSVSTILTLPLDLLSTENVFSDIFHGCFVVMCTLCAFISLVWLREQILHGGGPDWLEQDNAPFQQENNNEDIPEDQGANAQAPPAPAAEVQQPAQAGFPAAGGGGAPIAPPPPPLPPPALDAVNANNPVNGAGGGGGAIAAAAADDINWNPIEWDRAGEELTWERLLGLDGSLVFIEHVFWVISLNTLFIFIFGFCPYHIGAAISSFAHVRDIVSASHFEGLLTSLCGYCVIGMGLVFMHSIASLLRCQKWKRILGLCYVVVKVSLLAVVEIGVFPLICGWWLDICSLSLFDATLKDREHSFKMAPGTSMFIHWLVGMVYVFYFASFILLLREVLRPGVLWFLRNLNDPDFNPIQEMIHLPILKHTRRFLASMVIFGTTVLLMLWLPIRIVRYLWPSFLPYAVMLSSEAQVSELSLELLLLQVILPALLEQGHTRVWLKGLVLSWCMVMAWLLDLRSYLLGDMGNANNGSPNQEANADEDDEAEDAGAPAPAPPPPPPPAVGDGGFGVGLGAAHQALLHRDTPTGFLPYTRPNFFAVRIICLLGLVCLSLMVGSLITLTVPVWFGRQLMALWAADAKVHELYTAACGLYVCWLFARAVTLLVNWLPQGWNAIYQKMNQWLTMVGITSLLNDRTHSELVMCSFLLKSAKATVAFTVLVGVIPLLFGLLLELVVVVPLRVPLHQSPMFFISQDWALGVLYTKITCAVTMMGPNWWFKNAIERAYHDGIRNINLNFILFDVALPVVTCLGLALAVPYVISHTVLPLVVVSPTIQNMIARRIYPFLLLVLLVLAVVTFQVRQFRKLYEHIKNDKYLVGRRLVNYDHRTPMSQPQ